MLDKSPEKWPGFTPAEIDQIDDYCEARLREGTFCKELVHILLLGEPPQAVYRTVAEAIESVFQSPMQKELKEKLLALGGNSVLWGLRDNVIEALQQDGQVFEPEGKLVSGKMGYADQNVALRYARHHALDLGGHCQIVAGYALDEGGCWHEHSWLWTGDKVLETTQVYKLYFGAQLPACESVMFVFDNLMPSIPSFEDVFPED
jgi:hypothetical protein